MFTMGMLENTFSIFCSVVTSGYITYTSWKCRDTVCDTILGAGLFFFFVTICYVRYNGRTISVDRIKPLCQLYKKYKNQKRVYTHM